jgi:hypothetical protein
VNRGVDGRLIVAGLVVIGLIFVLLNFLARS